MAEAQDSLDVSDLKENFLECSVCLEHFDQADRRPRLLVNCLHSFCSQCLEQLLKKEGTGQVTCPNCRQVQKVKGTAQSLPVDPVRNKLVDYVKFKKGKKIPCSDCPDGSHAVARCHECQIYMCTPCKEAHRRNLMTRKHTCQSLEEALSEPVKNFLSHRCQDHPDYKIEFYCGQCSSLCCVSCPIVKHRGHILDPIEDAANSMLSSLKTKIEDVEKSAAVMRRKKTSLKEKSRMQKVNLKNTTASIKKTFDELIGKFTCQRNKLITELKDRTESTVNDLEKQCEATEDNLAQMESTLEYFKQMESKSDDCEVLSAGPVLVQSLKAAAAVDLTEDVQDPTWTFSTGEMDSVISKVHRFGEIHSDTTKSVVGRGFLPGGRRSAVGVRGTLREAHLSEVDLSERNLSNAPEQRITGADNIQMVDTYEKEYTKVHFKCKASSILFESEVTLPEWKNIKEIPKLRRKLETELPEFKINFDSPKNISVEYLGNLPQTLKDKLLDVLTAIRRTLMIQSYRIPIQYHDIALKKLHESDAYQNKKGTYWRSHDGVFVFVVDRETKEGLDEFVSIICSLQRSDKGKGENHQPDVQGDHHLQREARAMGEEASTVLHTFKDDLNRCELKALEKRDTISIFVNSELQEKGTSCTFDLKVGKVEFCSREKHIHKIKSDFHSLFNEVSKSMTSVLQGFSLEEIRDNIYASLGSASDLVVISPEQDHVITIFGIAECVKIAEDTLTRFMKDFQNADFYPFKVPGEKFSTTLWQEVTDIADKVPQGRVKVLPYDYDPSSLLAFGRKECIDEFQRMVMTQCSQEKCFPIMDPQLSLLTARRDVVAYLTEEAMKMNFQLEVDLENKRYSIFFRCDQQTEVDHFLRDWCKTEELKYVQGTEKTKEMIDTYLKSCVSDIYNRLLLKVNGSTIHLITTAKDFDRVTVFLDYWRKSEGERTSSKERVIDFQTSEKSKSVTFRSMSSSHLDTDSSDAGGDSNAATVDNDDDEERITKSADGTIRMRCKLHYPLTEYCRKTDNCRRLVVEEFKTQGFEIQIDKKCKMAEFTLSNEKDKTKIKHILNSFGSRQFDLAGRNCFLNARELRSRVFKENPSVTDKTIQIYVPYDNNALMLFGLNWQLDVLCLQVKEMLDDFEVQTFSISLSKYLKENEVKKQLEKETRNMPPFWNFAFEDKELRVQVANSYLEGFRTVVYDQLEDMNENNPQDNVLQASFSVSQQMLDFLQITKINKELKEKFKAKNLSFAVAKSVRFGALSYSSLKQADLLFKGCVIVKRHNLQSKPIGIMLQGEDLTGIFEPRAELLVYVDDAHVLNVICLSHVLQQVEQELQDKCGEYDEDIITLSIEDLEMKMASEMLTLELFELDKALMGQVKVLVDGESLRIVAKRDLLPHARMKVGQILQRIETEKETTVDLADFDNYCQILQRQNFQRQTQ